MPFGAMAPWGLKWRKRDRSDSSNHASWFLTSWCVTPPGVLWAVYRKALVSADRDIVKSRLSSSIRTQSTYHDTHLGCAQKRLEGWTSKCSLDFDFSAGDIQGFLRFLNDSWLEFTTWWRLVSPVEWKNNAANVHSPTSGAMQSLYPSSWLKMYSLCSPWLDLPDQPTQLGGKGIQDVPRSPCLW